LKELNLFNDIPKGNYDRSFALRQTETLDELSFAAYKASKTSKEKSSKTSKRNRDDRKTSNNSKKNISDATSVNV